MDERDENSNDARGQSLAELFTFFNEIGIINQLSSSLFQKRLADGVTIAQFSVLSHLCRVKDGQTPLVLASAFQVPKTSMTHTLSGLEKRGLVEVKPNKEDGRSKCIWITESGREFRDQSIAALAQDMMRLAPHLDLEEMINTIPILEKVRTVLDADRD